MPRFGHALGSSSVQDRLAYQASRPLPLVSDHFYLDTTDFLLHVQRDLDAINRQHEKSGAPALENRVPAQLYSDREDLLSSGQQRAGEWLAQGMTVGEIADADDALRRKLFNTGYSKFLAISLDGADGDQRKAVLDLMAELNTRFGLVAAKMSVHDGEGNSHSYLACAQTQFTKRADGQWIETPNPQASAQFFGLAVARGVVDERALYENNVMLGKKNIATLSQIKQLRDEGVTPLMDTPIRTASSTLSR